MGGGAGARGSLAGLDDHDDGGARDHHDNHDYGSAHDDNDNDDHNDNNHSRADHNKQPIGAVASLHRLRSRTDGLMQSWFSAHGAKTKQKFGDSYDVVRALLGVRGADDSGIDSIAAKQILKSFYVERDAQHCAALAAEAEHHGVAPLLAPMIAALADAARDTALDDVNRTFIALLSRQRRAAAVREKCIDELLLDFANAKVRVVLLKGAALAHLIYPNPALRPMADIDVLVDPADAEHAAAMARARGFSFAHGHESRFAGRMHHLPVAAMKRSGFRIALEIHHDAISSDLGGGLTLADLAEPPRPFRRGGGPDGIALSHIDMLRHLARHAFVPAERVRLIHLYDLWRYQAKFRDEIDWQALAARFPDVIVVLRLVSYVFAQLPSDAAAAEPIPAGVGRGMLPMSEIAAARNGIVAKLDALFNPPAWWLHGFYGVAPEKSLLACRCLWHPATVAWWLAKRLAAGIAGPAPDIDFNDFGPNNRVAATGK